MSAVRTYGISAFIRWGWYGLGVSVTVRGLGVHLGPVMLVAARIEP